MLENFDRFMTVPGYIYVLLLSKASDRELKFFLLRTTRRYV